MEHRWGEPMSVRLSPEQRAALAALAAEQQRSTSSVVREAVSRLLEESPARV